MSRNRIKIIKSLAKKGYKPIDLEWNGSGYDGGWYITYTFLDDNSDDPVAFDYLWGWSMSEILSMIDELCLADDEREAAKMDLEEEK